MGIPSLITSLAKGKTLILLMFLGAICCAPWGFAQEGSFKPFPRYEVFGGYLASGQTGDYTNLELGHLASLPTSFGSTHGGEASFLYNFNRFLGLKADFSVQPHTEHSTITVLSCASTPCAATHQSASFNPKMFNFLAGPEVKFRNHSRFTPYVHGLIGVAHADGSLHTPGPVINLTLEGHATGFSAAVGGGSDIRLTRRFSFSTGMDFNPARVGHDDLGSTTVVNNIRIWAGILFH